MKMKIHPTKVEGFDGTLEELAQRILRMRYDKVAEFQAYCREELLRQSKSDEAVGKFKLSKLLLEAQEITGELQKKMEEIFDECKPFMKDELDNEK